MALLLALVGFFSVVSYGVAQKTTEFGIRMALGASKSHILWVAARASVLSAASGLVCGIVLDLFMRKVLSQWIGSGHSGLSALLATISLLAFCTMAACLYLPAGQHPFIQSKHCVTNSASYSGSGRWIYFL